MGKEETNLEIESLKKQLSLTQAELQDHKDAIKRCVEYAETLISHLPRDYIERKLDEEYKVDSLGRILYTIENEKTKELENIPSSDFVLFAMLSTLSWIQDLEMSLGQIRSLVKNGFLGEEPLTCQDGRPVRNANNLGFARPIDVILDVSVEIARLSRGLPREDD